MTRAALALRILVGITFLAAGAGKLLAERGTRIAPLILGDVAGGAMVAGAVVEDALPSIEVLAGVAFLLAIGRIARLLAGSALAMVFLAGAWLVPDGVRCGCFGLFGGFESRGAHLAAAAGLLGAITATGILERRRRSP